MMNGIRMKSPPFESRSRATGRSASRGRKVFGAEGAGDAHRPFGDGLAEVILLELGADVVPDDVVRLEIGQPAADALAGLDPDLALGGGDRQEDAVVFALVSELPGVERFEGRVVDVLAVERAGDQHGDLRAGRGVLAGDEIFEVALVLGRELAGGVDDASAELRHLPGERDRRPGEREAREDEGKDAARHHRPQNFTSGAAWLSAVALK